MSFFGTISSINRRITGVVAEPVLVVFELSQSNAGFSEADRIALTDQIQQAGITKMTYTKTPANCKIWNKQIMDLTDNGVMEDISAGVNTSQYNKAPHNARCFGTEVSLSPLLKQHSSSNVYYIKAMRGGTRLFQYEGEDWNANSTNDLLDIALDYYATPAINQIIQENPNKPIKVVLLRHQGEADNTTEMRDAYYANTTAFLNKIRNYTIGGVKYFENSPFIDVLLYYKIAEAQEGLMNDVKTQFANDNANCYTIDISDQPRKVDLTTAQKGGYSPTILDNEHQSYLGQLMKGERIYDLLKNINWV
jgi:hypothetical protein